MTEKKFLLTLLSSADSELLTNDYQDAIDLQGGDQVHSPWLLLPM